MSNVRYFRMNQKVLYFETTVEPQFMGNQHLCYSHHARSAYEAWIAEHEVIDAPPWPESLPAPPGFISHPVWNQFRAEALADWINGDMAAFRDVAGEDTWIAVDYLETGGPEMSCRLGEPVTFLENLDRVEILQVNWHWNKRTRSPNIVAYLNVRSVNRNWAITEHMTLNGSDYQPDEVADVLYNTLENGTRFGWEFVNIAPSSNDPFAHYYNDWSPNPLIAEVDDKWDYWMEQLRNE